MSPIRRTTMYSSGGKKLYAVRNADGIVQGHPDLRARASRRHGAQERGRKDDRRAQGREEEAARKKAAKKVAKKAAKKAPARKRAAKKGARRK